jgi:hypothetical protein
MISVVHTFESITDTTTVQICANVNSKMCKLSEGCSTRDPNADSNGFNVPAERIAGGIK